MGAALVPLGVRMAILARSRLRHLAVVFAVLGLYLFRTWQGMADEPDRIRETVGSAVSLFAYTVPLVFAGTFRDMAGGVATLWLQKPIHPVHFHLVRYLEATSVSIAVLLAVAACGATFVLIGDPSYTGLPAARILAVAALVPLLIISVGFGLSAWLPRVGGLATAAFLGLTFATEIQTALAMTSPEPPPVGWARRLLIPLWAFRDLGDSMRGAAPFSFAGLAWILGYAGAWVGLGALGIRHSMGGRAGWRTGRAAG